MSIGLTARTFRKHQPRPTVGNPIGYTARAQAEGLGATSRILISAYISTVRFPGNSEIPHVTNRYPGVKSTSYTMMSCCLIRTAPALR